MNDKRQNTQKEFRSIFDPRLRLALMPGVAGEAQDTTGGRVESFYSSHENQSPTSPLTVMQEVFQPDNLEAALAQVQANKGSPGIDGMTVKQLPAYLGLHWHRIRQQLLEATYKPQPVKRVEIPKPDGGVRKLGIRRRLRRVVLRHWRGGRRRFAELTKRGVGKNLAAKTAGSCHGPWRLSRSPALHIALPTRFWDWLGVERVLVKG